MVKADAQPFGDLDAAQIKIDGAGSNPGDYGRGGPAQDRGKGAGAEGGMGQAEGPRGEGNCGTPIAASDGTISIRIRGAQMIKQNPAGNSRARFEFRDRHTEHSQQRQFRREVAAMLIMLKRRG